MKKLVDGLAHLSGLRDRDDLDCALVRLVIGCDLEGVQSARLVRVLGEGESRRCLTRAAVDVAQNEVVSDSGWTDWDALPLLSQFPHWLEAVDHCKLTQVAQPTCACIFPIGGHGVWALLELGSHEPLSELTCSLVEGIVRAYQNIYGLLDYGEMDALTELREPQKLLMGFLKAAAHQEYDAAQEDRRNASTGGKYWLGLLDIDHFKRVNDSFGHLIGDEVLLLVAQLMRKNFRFHDQLYRFGGEEFVILMSCENAGDARAALERLRVSVEEHMFPQVGCITVSIGFSLLMPNDTPAGLFGRADKAVYHAKEHGRNQVCSYQDLVETGALVEAASEEMDVDLF